MDAAIIFSDILVVPDAMGLPYEMVESRGPLFPTTIKTFRLKKDADDWARRAEDETLLAMLAARSTDFSAGMRQ